ncbi:MAG: hypothetical protein KKA42_01220 [candidate division Zixibacteria bacterium]|nr:hypothetical protein [candidate division Zixibacteria bacterium]
MKNLKWFVLAAVCILFAVSWFAKASGGDGVDNSVLDAFLVTLAAFLTLAIMSFLYQDNPYYKFAEHLFVGVSAAYWMCLGFWSTVVGNLFPRISEGLSNFFLVPYQPGPLNFFFAIPIILGILLLMRLSPKGGWLSRWPLAFIVGTTAGLNFVRYLRSDFVKQISSTFVPLVVDWQGFGHFFSNISLTAGGPLVMMLTNLVIFIGVFCGIVYFFFSKEHTGVFGKASRVGIWILMITFGASFGYTVMGRISLLVGRLTFLFTDWLGIIG